MFIFSLKLALFMRKLILIFKKLGSIKNTKEMQHLNFDLIIKYCSILVRRKLILVKYFMGKKEEKLSSLHSNYYFKSHIINIIIVKSLRFFFFAYIIDGL